LDEIFIKASTQGEATNLVADSMAEQIIASARHAQAPPVAPAAGSRSDPSITREVAIHECSSNR
jgi:hypothetical protein